MPARHPLRERAKLATFASVLGCSMGWHSALRGPPGRPLFCTSWRCCGVAGTSCGSPAQGPVSVMVAGSMNSHRPAWRSCPIGGAAIVAVAVSAFLLGRYLPRESASSAATCSGNLRAIHGATLEWAAAQHKAASDRPRWEDLQSYLVRYGKSHYACPAGGKYSLGTPHTPPTCSTLGHTL